MDNESGVKSENDLVRYEVSQEDDQSVNYIDYEFAYDMNTNIDSVNFNLNHISENTNTEVNNNIPRTNLEEKSNNKNHKETISNPSSNYLSNKKSSKHVVTHPYETNLSNVNEKFNFNNDSDIDIDPKEKADSIFEQEVYLNKNSKLLVSRVDSRKAPLTTKLKPMIDLINKVSLVELEGVSKLKNLNYKTIDENDQVNFHDEVSDKFQLQTRKLNNEMNSSIEETNYELAGHSEQIKNFFLSNDIEKLNNSKDIEVDAEIEYIKKLKSLKDENNELKQKLEERKDTNKVSNSENDFENKKLREELEETKSKLEKKIRECMDYKSKYDTLLYDYEHLEKKVQDFKQQNANLKNELTDKDSLMNNIKLDLKKKDEYYKGYIDENNNYKQQIENIKFEFNQQRHELTKKAEKITELQQRIFNLEQENIVIVLFYF